MLQDKIFFEFHAKSAILAVYVWSSFLFAKLILGPENHFGKKTAWSLIYLLIYAYLNILAQSQILSNSL